MSLHAEQTLSKDKIVYSEHQSHGSYQIRHSSSFCTTSNPSTTTNTMNSFRWQRSDRHAIETPIYSEMPKHNLEWSGSRETFQKFDRPTPLPATRFAHPMHP